MDEIRPHIWKVLAEDFGSPMVHPASYIDAASSNKLRDICGIAPESSIGEWKNRLMYWAFPEENYLLISKAILKKLEDKSFFKRMVDEGLDSILKLQTISQLLKKLDLSSQSNLQLYNVLIHFYQVYRHTNVWGHIQNCVDFDHFLLSAKLHRILERHSKDNKLNQEAFVILTTSPKMTPLKEHERQFLKMMAKIDAGADEQKLIKFHSKKYDWVIFKYDGPALADEKYFKDLVKDYRERGIDPLVELKRLDENDKNSSQKQDEIQNSLILSKDEAYWFEVARETMFLKAMRKDVAFYAGRSITPILEEIAKRIGRSLLQIRYMTLKEFKNALLDGEVISNRILNSRVQHCIWYCWQDETKVVLGEELKRLEKNIVHETVSSDIKKIKGMVACIGKAKGEVRLISSVGDMKKMTGGNILISPATNPDLMPAIRKAAAIVTDEGGITCHAAIVSRELGIPCVIGTKIATKALKDGDIVEVDASLGIINILGN